MDYLGDMFVCVFLFVLLYVYLCVPPGLDEIFLCLFLGECSVRYTRFYGCIPRVSIRYFRWNSFYLPGGLSGSLVWVTSGFRLGLV